MIMGMDDDFSQLFPIANDLFVSPGQLNTRGKTVHPVDEEWLRRQLSSAAAKRSLLDVAKILAARHELSLAEAWGILLSKIREKTEVSVDFRGVGPMLMSISPRLFFWVSQNIIASHLRRLDVDLTDDLDFDPNVFRMVQRGLQDVAKWSSGEISEEKFLGSLPVIEESVRREFPRVWSERRDPDGSPSDSLVSGRWMIAAAGLFDNALAYAENGYLNVDHIMMRIVRAMIAAYIAEHDLDTTSATRQLAATRISEEASDLIESFPMPRPWTTGAGKLSVSGASAATLAVGAAAGAAIAFFAKKR